jgi:hypothetical protein
VGAGHQLRAVPAGRRGAPQLDRPAAPGAPRVAQCDGCGRPLHGGLHLAGGCFEEGEEGEGGEGGGGHPIISSFFPPPPLPF